MRSGKAHSEEQYVCQLFARRFLKWSGFKRDSIDHFNFSSWWIDFVIIMFHNHKYHDPAPNITEMQIFLPQKKKKKNAGYGQ